MKKTPIGETIDLPTPPTAINDELYPDFYGKDHATLEDKVKKRQA